MTGVLARARDWLFGVPFLAAFGGTLLAFDVLQRLALPFGRRAHEWVVNGLQISLSASLRLCGTRFEFEVAPDTPGPPCLFIANHQSMLDIPIFGAVLRDHHLKFVSKEDLARRWIPSISFNLRHGGNALIDRAKRESALAAIRRLGEDEVTGRGVSAVIFPEGTRARTGVLGPFKTQGLVTLMAAAPGAPVVPMAIDGSWRLLRHGLMPVPFGTRVRVFIGRAVPRQAGEDPLAVLEAARREIEDTLARWRGADQGGGEPPRGA